MSRHDRELDRYLDGELPVEQLSDELRRDEERLRTLFEAVREEVRAPATLRAAVLGEIRGDEPSVWRRAIDWWARPRAIRVSPAAGALALAASLVVFLVLPRSEAARGPSGGVVESTVVTRFVLVAPEASSVQLTGDFASWSPEGIEMEDIRGTGVWTADVPLPPGVYQYTFIVNGTEWRPDPTAVSQVEDGFGQTNSVVIVSLENAA